MKAFIVEEIEFDFDDWYERNWDNSLIKEEQKFITDNALGVWHVTEEDQLVDFITDTTGWCVKSIKYCSNRPHALTAFK